MASSAEKISHTPGAIVVRETEGGDFTVVRGGDVYRKLRGQPVPGEVKAGMTVSAGEICEWIECGVSVEPALPIAKAAFREYGQHSGRCATETPNRWGDAGPCDCGFDTVSTFVAKAEGR